MKVLRTLATTAALSGALFVAGGAGAVPILPGSETSLQGILNKITTNNGVCSNSAGGCTSSIDVNTDQTEPHGLWQIGGAGGAFSQIIIEIAGNAASNSFGLYDPFTMSTFQIYSGPQGAGAKSIVSILDDGQIEFNLIGTGVYFTTNLFGFYLAGPAGTWYSQDDLNADGHQHVVAFEGTGADRIRPCLATSCGSGSTSAGAWLPSEYIFGWEDLAFGSSDLDFNDFVILVESITPVPEPSTLALLGIGLLGLGYVSKRNRAIFRT